MTRGGVSVRLLAAAAAVTIALAAPTRPSAQTAAAQPRHFEFASGDALDWRPIGPFRAGPITAATGDPSRLGVFYAASSGGGLWKTTDFGASWQPVFEAPPVGMVTAVAVAPSDSNVVFASAGAPPSSRHPAGTLYRSADAGASWQPVGLPSRHLLTRLVVDPSDSRRLFATLGADATPAGGQDIFRSVDSGLTFERIGRSANQGADVFVQEGRPSTLIIVGTTDDDPLPAVLRSTDGGASFQAVLGLQALGTSGAQRIDIAGSSGAALVLLMATDARASLYRSEDAGASWALVNADLPDEVRASAEPRLAISPDGTIVIAAGHTFASTDGGRSFTSGFQPPGRNTTIVWAHPTANGVMLLAGGTGAAITVNGGATWSSADAIGAPVVDRISTDAAFPFRVCAAQGGETSCAPVYPDGRVTMARDWQDLPARLAGPVVADPLDPDVVFGGSGLRHDRRTGQTVSVEPADVPSTDRTIPMVFSGDGRTLFAGAGAVWRTVNGGLAWTPVGPDLTVLPGTVGGAARISALTISPIDARTLWVGLSDGRVSVTRNGGAAWIEAARPAGPGAAAIRGLEPSRFDTNSAYAVISYDDERDDASPRLVRTRDSGVSWTDIGANIASAGAIHVVREDPLRRGLLYAGTDDSVFISFDDGERWQSLKLNLPASPVRDLQIRDADLVAGTAGRGVWVLADVSPLRQATADVLRAPLFLFRPAPAWRVRAAAGPVSRAAVAPEARGGRGAALTYVLGDGAQDVTLEVIETTTGDVIRRFPDPRASNAREADGSTRLATNAGLHRVSWDLRYTPPVPGAADAAPGTAVLPGVYQVRLTVDGRSVRQAITVRMDPRIRTSIVDLTAQRDLGRSLDRARAAVDAARRTSRSGEPDVRLAAVAGELERLADTLQQADVRPAARLEAAIEAALERAAAAIGADAR